MKKIFYTIIILGIVTLCSQKVSAATVAITHVPLTVAQQEQFYVDVTVDSQGKAFNAIQGTVVFSGDTLSFVRAETGTSDISLFIQPPTLKGNTISFAGIIPGGFNGLIDPFNPAVTMPGQIVRLVFAGKAAGEAQIIATGISVADNDGQGTLEAVPDQQNFLSVSTMVAPSIYKPTDTRAPKLTASVVKESDLYNDNYTLIFNAIDKQSGVDYVELKEGDDAWTTIQSPYVLHDQSRKSILLLRAYDIAGNVSSVVEIDPISSPRWVSWMKALLGIILSLLIIIFGYGIYKKRTLHDL